MNNASILYNDKTQRLKFQGKAMNRIPPLERYLISKRETEGQTRGFNAEDIEKEKHHIREHIEIMLRRV